MYGKRVSSSEIAPISGYGLYSSDRKYKISYRICDEWKDINGCVHYSNISRALVLMRRTMSMSITSEVKVCHCSDNSLYAYYNKEYNSFYELSQGDERYLIDATNIFIRELKLQNKFRTISIFEGNKGSAGIKLVLLDGLSTRTIHLLDVRDYNKNLKDVLSLDFLKSIKWFITQVLWFDNRISEINISYASDKYQSCSYSGDLVGSDRWPVLNINIL